MRTWMYPLTVALLGLAGCAAAPSTVEKVVRVPCPPAAPTLRCPPAPTVEGLTLEAGDAAWADALRQCRAVVDLWAAGHADCLNPDG